MVFHRLRQCWPRSRGEPRVTYQVCRDSGGDQCVEPTHQGPTEKQHGCGKQGELRTEPAQPSSPPVEGGHLQERGPSHRGHLQDTGQMASVLCVPGDTLSCFPQASEACLEDLELKLPGLHGQQLMAVMGREGSLGVPGLDQHWVYAITSSHTWNVLSSPQWAGTLNHVSPPLNWPSSFS